MDIKGQKLCQNILLINIIRFLLIIISFQIEMCWLHSVNAKVNKEHLPNIRNRQPNLISSVAPSLSRAELVVQQTCKEEDEDAIIIKNGIKHLITSPGFPDPYPRKAYECQWKFKLSKVDLDSDFVLRCDHFDVGRAQESGRCWSDALLIYGDETSVLRNRHNRRKIDHLSICGRRDGFQIRAVANEADEVVIKFRTGNGVQKSGFSCLVYTTTEGINEEKDGSVIDLNSDNVPHQCHCGRANHPTSAHNADVVNRIIGGNEAQGNEYPWQVALVEDDQHTPFCGGSLISNRHVLTAAHCTADIQYPRDVNVLLGEHDVTTSFDRAIRVRVSRINEHPGYNKNSLANDFSMLHLVEKVKMSKYVRPICLPDVTDLTRETFEGKQAKVIGWGYQSLDATHYNPLPTSLKHLKLEVIGNKECSERYKQPSGTGWVTQIVPGMVCAETSNASSCFGDSGGPLAYVDMHEMYTLIGVVSFGPYTCVDPIIPSVFARVNHVIEWIRSYVKSADDVCPPAFQSSTNIPSNSP